MRKRHGDNVLSIVVHYDETTPHIHALVVPLDATGKLNAKSFTNGRAAMRDMQTDYAKLVKHLGIERGTEGSRAQHTTTKQYQGELLKAIAGVAPEVPQHKWTLPEKGGLFESATEYQEKVRVALNAQLKDVTAAHGTARIAVVAAREASVKQEAAHRQELTNYRYQVFELEKAVDKEKRNVATEIANRAILAKKVQDMETAIRTGDIAAIKAMHVKLTKAKGVSKGPEL